VYTNTIAFKTLGAYWGISKTEAHYLRPRHITWDRGTRVRGRGSENCSRCHNTASYMQINWSKTSVSHVFPICLIFLPLYVHNNNNRFTARDNAGEQSRCSLTGPTIGCLWATCPFCHSIYSMIVVHLQMLTSVASMDGSCHSDSL